VKRLAFVDHSFHRASRSSDFFKELLDTEYDISTFFDETWSGGEEADVRLINAGNFDVVIFWQSLPAPLSLLRLNCENLIWVPMFDSEWRLAGLAWRALRAINMKVICFSKKIFDAAQKDGVSSYYAQYFPALPPQSVQYDAPRVFFWQRTNLLTWALIRRLLSGSNVEKTILRDDPDPEHVFEEPSHDDVERFNIEIARNIRIASGGQREDYLKMLSECNIFVAPRLREGIGLTFLEAMAMGMCVIGPDLPTLNEYVESRWTGYLFDPRDPTALDISHFTECGIRARAAIGEGRKEWLAGIPTMKQFISGSSATRRSPFVVALVCVWGIASAARRRYERTFGAPS
jgi:hypothetical protein